MWSCSATKNLSENETLLASNKINYVDKENHKHLDEDGMTAVIRQKPNRKILGIWRFHLAAYNITTSEKIEQKNKKKRERLNKRNERRQEKGKDTIEFNPHWLDWLRNTVGEPPVIIDSNLASESTSQLERYLFNNGFFDNQVNYQIEYKHRLGFTIRNLFQDSIAPEVEERLRTPKANIIYHINTGPVYKIAEVSFSIEDVQTLKAVKTSVKNSLLSKGSPYQVDVIEEERSRLTSSMRDQGYYDFQKEFIYYRIDSTLANNQVSIKQVITSPKEKVVDSTTTLPHRKYKVRNVYINTNYRANTSFIGTDTLKKGNLIFLNKELMQYNPDLLIDNIFIQSGDYYNEERETYTYSRLAALKNFKFINIAFEKLEGAGNDTIGYLDCTIRLTSSAQQSLGAEAEGTHRSSNLGVSGSLKYTNKNMFRGAERLEIRLQGGLEAQQISNVSSSEENANQSVSGALPFNTLEYGGEMSLYIPELIIPFQSFSPIKLPKYNEPKTNINLRYNFQQRPDFTRTILNASFSYLFSITGENSNNFTLYPVDIAFIGIDKSAAFENLLNDLNSSVLSASYNNLFITSTRILHAWSNQRGNRKSKNSTALFTNLEFSGNILQTAFSTSSAQTNESGSYELFGNQFSQFIKADSEVRVQKQLTNSTRIVYRGFAGIGVPYGNSKALPFVKSFFGGGANDIRAWQARTLGPGGLPDSLSQGIDHIGDILLEANVEYRFPIVDFLEGAAFVDAGNIWLLEEQEQRPLGSFKWDQFYRQIAVGAGFGLRFDFSFLIFRFDAALPIHDPGLPPGERWIFETKDTFNSTSPEAYQLGVNFNLGIGYPF